LPYCMNVSRHAQIVADGQWASRIMSSVSSTSPSIAPSIADSESSGVNEPISRSPYSAKLLGRSDEELASSFEYTPAYLPVNRLLIDGSMHDW